MLVIAAEVVRLRRSEHRDPGPLYRLEARRRQRGTAADGRDLHDVIGHNISLINVQAGVGLDLMDTHPEQARAALAAIKTVSKDALDELRTMLVAFRQGDEKPHAPAPSLDRLDELVELDAAPQASRSRCRPSARPGRCPPRWIWPPTASCKSP